MYLRVCVCIEAIYSVTMVLWYCYYYYYYYVLLRHNGSSHFLLNFQLPTGFVLVG